MRYTTKLTTTAAALALAFSAAAFAGDADVINPARAQAEVAAAVPQAAPAVVTAADFVGPMPRTDADLRAQLDKFFGPVEQLMACNYDAACIAKILKSGPDDFRLEQVRGEALYGKNGADIADPGLKKLAQIAFAATTPEQAEAAALRGALILLFQAEVMARHFAPALHISGGNPVAVATGMEGLLWVEDPATAVTSFTQYAATISDKHVAHVYATLRAPNNGIAAFGTGVWRAMRNLIAR